MSIRNFFLSALMLLSAHSACAMIDEAVFYEKLAECQTAEEQAAVLIKHSYMAQHAVTVFTIACPDGCPESVKDDLKAHLNNLKDILFVDGMIDQEAFMACRQEIAQIIEGFSGLDPAIRMSLHFKDVTEPRLYVTEVDNVIALVSVCTPAMYSQEDWVRHCAEVVSMVQRQSESDEATSAEEIFSFIVDMYNSRIK